MNPANLFFFAIGILSNLVLTPLFIRFARRHGLVDMPGNRKIHEKPVPFLGGAAILLSILISVFTGLALLGPVLDLTPEREAKMLLVLSVTTLAGLLGFFDDLYDLKPRYKLLFQTLLFGTFTIIGFHFQFMHIPGLAPFDMSLFGIPLTLVWILAVVNGFNFMDGVDGLAGSVSAVVFLGIGVTSMILKGPNHVGTIWLAALGAVLVFLFFNWKPAKIYLGDAGSNALGALAATSLVTLGQGKPFLLDLFDGGGLDPQPIEEPYRFQFLVATLIVGYPLVEVVLSTLRRGVKRFFLGRSLEWSEQEHLHHQLLKMGLKADSICVWAILFQGLLTSAALLAVVHQNALATWLLIPLVMILAYFGPRSGFFDFLRLNQSQAKLHFQIANYFISMQRVKLRLTRSREEVLALVTQSCGELGIRCFRFFIKPDHNGKGSVDYNYQDPQVTRHRMEGLQDFSDENPPDEYFDYCEIPSQRGEAFWLFNEHSRADELDLEYRVLMSGFMREALERTTRLGEGLEPLAMSSVEILPHGKISSHQLRKRHNIKMN